MSTEAIYDWKGNEVKAGMTIYFVQTKPGVLQSSRMGIMFTDASGVVHQQLEPKEHWLERKNKEVWNLGEEMLVLEDQNGRLYVNTVAKGEGELEGYTFNSQIDLLMQKKWSLDLTIAIKGISDIKDVALDQPLL